MKLQRTLNAKKNILSGLVNRTVIIICPFIMRTILIKQMGAQYLGINSLFISILQFLNLAESGIGSAIVFSMYKPIANNDEEAICALLSFYRKAYRYIGGFILCLGVILIPFLPKLIYGSYPSEINISIIYCIYLLNTIFSYYVFAYKAALLNAYQRTEVLNFTEAFVQVIMTIVQSFILIYYSNYLLYVLVFPLCTIIKNIINAVIIKKMYPQYECRGKLDKTVLEEIRYKIFGLLIHKICQTSRTSFDSIFITSFLGLTIAAIYSNYLSIISALGSITIILSNAILAGIGNSMETESLEKNYKDFKKFNYLYMWFSGICSICLFCLYQPFMELWMGKQLMFGTITVLFFCIYYYLLQMGVVRGMYSDAAGLWWENRFRAVAESAANLLLNFIFVKKWGVNGIIMATVLSCLIINFGYGSRLVFRYYFKNEQEIKNFYLNHLKYFLVTLLGGVIAYKICNNIILDGISGIIAKGIICFIVTNLWYLCIYRKEEERKYLFWLMKNLGIAFKKN